MITEEHVDVLVVGAGTAGSYLSRKLAAAGYECLVLEKEPLEALGSDIGPFHMEEVAFERFDIPPPADGELLHTESRMTMWAPGLRRSFSFRMPTLVMDKPLFIQRLHRRAREAGVRIVEGTAVEGLVMEDGYLQGVMARGADGELEVRARLVIDASGINGAVRTMMPPGRMLESSSISDEDTIFVYMETWRDIEGELSGGVLTYPHCQGWCAPGPGDTRIVGIGMAGSVEAARERHREFAATLPYRGEVVGSTGGRVPYRRPPYTLVDNRLMVVGDAAFMNKPFSGEGVTSGFAACDIATGVAGDALAADDLTREALWPYNTRYFRGQGAKFAFLTAVLPALLSVSQGELELFFSVPGLLTDEGAVALQLEYEVRADPTAIPGIVSSLIRGITGRDLRPSSLAGLAYAGTVAAAIKALYLRYPQRPADFGTWVRAVGPLWRAAERKKHRYFTSRAVTK